MVALNAFVIIGWFLLIVNGPYHAVLCVVLYRRRKLFPVKGAYRCLVCHAFCVVRALSDAVFVVDHLLHRCMRMPLCFGRFFVCLLQISTMIGLTFVVGVDRVPCSVVFDVIVCSFELGITTGPLRRTGLLFQFEIAKALLESERLRKDGNAAAALQIISSNFYLKNKDFITPRVYLRYLAVVLVLCFVYVFATAPYSHFPDGCNAYNRVCSVLCLLCVC